MKNTERIDLIQLVQQKLEFTHPCRTYGISQLKKKVKKRSKYTWKICTDYTENLFKMTLKNARNYKWLEFIKLLAKITRTKGHIQE